MVSGSPSGSSRRIDRRKRITGADRIDGCRIDIHAHPSIAEVLRVSSITVMREWSTAKAWLYQELSGKKSNGFRSLETDR